MPNTKTADVREEEKDDEFETSPPELSVPVDNQAFNTIKAGQKGDQTFSVDGATVHLNEQGLTFKVETKEHGVRGFEYQGSGVKAQLLKVHDSNGLNLSFDTEKKELSVVVDGKTNVLKAGRFYLNESRNPVVELADGTKREFLANGDTRDRQKDGAVITRNKFGQITELVDATGKKSEFKWSSTGPDAVMTEMKFPGTTWKSTDGKLWTNEKSNPPQWTGRVEVTSAGIKELNGLEGKSGQLLKTDGSRVVYDQNGQVSEITDANGKKTSLKWSGPPPAGFVSEQSDANGTYISNDGANYYKVQKSGEQPTAPWTGKVQVSSDGTVTETGSKSGTRRTINTDGSSVVQDASNNVTQVNLSKGQVWKHETKDGKETITMPQGKTFVRLDGDENGLARWQEVKDGKGVGKILKGNFEFKADGTVILTQKNETNTFSRTGSFETRDKHDRLTKSADNGRGTVLQYAPDSIVPVKKNEVVAGNSVRFDDQNRVSGFDLPGGLKVSVVRNGDKVTSLEFSNGIKFQAADGNQIKVLVPGKGEQTIPQLPPGMTLDELVKKMNGATPTEQVQAVELLRKALDQPALKTDEQIAQDIVVKLGPESSPEEIKKAREALVKEIEESRRAGRENKAAEQWLKWVNVTEQTSLISKAAKANDWGSVDRAMKELEKMAKEGNDFARAGISAVLVGSSDEKTISSWIHKYGQMDGKPIYVPNLKGLNDWGMNQSMWRAAYSLQQLQGPRSLKESEMAAVAIAISQVGKTADLDLLRDRLLTTLQFSLQDTAQKRTLEERNNAMKGILFAIEAGIPGVEKLTIPALRYHELPAFSAALPRMEKLALEQNKAAIRIVAAMAAGRFDKDANANPPDKLPAHERARRILEELGERPGQKAEIARAILEIQNRTKTEYDFGDKHKMLATLGKVAAGLPPAENALLQEVKDTLKRAERDYSVYPAGLRSAHEGFANLAKRWTKEDAEFYVSHLDSNAGDQLMTAISQMKPEIAQYTKELLLSRLSSEGGMSAQMRLDTMKALVPFADRLTTNEVKFVASLGGDERYNTDGKGGAAFLRRAGVYGDGIKEFQATAAEILVHVLARTPNAAQGTVGPREMAYEAFKNLPWPMRDGKGGFTPSHESDKLKDALVKYYEGRPFEPELAAQINRIVDNAKLPRPAADIINRLGIGTPGKPGESFVLQRAEQIVKNYGTATESGQEVLRRVISNVEMINTMPPADRAKLMGWTDLPDEEKKALGWISEPPADVKQQVGWDRMTEAQKENMRWAGTKIDPMQVLGQMYTNKLQESNNAALLSSNLANQVSAMRQGHAREVELLTTKLNELNQEKRGEKGDGGLLADIEKHTKDGVSFGSKLSNIFNNARDEEFDKQQKALLEKLADLNSKIKETEEQKAAADTHQHALGVARDVAEYHRLLNVGEQVAADKLAIKMWSEHGPALSQLAPSVWKDLTVNTDNTLQGASILKRLRDRGLGQVDVIPGYAAGEPGNTDSSLLGFKQALGMVNANNGDKPVGLQQLSRNEGLLDSAALRAHMLGRLDQDPVLSKVSTAAREMNGPLEELGKMFSAAQSGTIYEGFIKVAKEKAGLIKEQMEKITEKDLRDLEKRIDLMQQALNDMKRNGGNQEAIKELEDRVKTYQNMHNMFNKFDANPKYPQAMEKATDDDGKPINPNKNTMAMLNMILDNGLQPSTFTTWLKQNGILIGVTVAAVAATVAACATFGVTSPAAVGLWVAVAGLAAREVTNEVLFQVNKNGYTGYGAYGQTGSRIGHWGREIPNRDALDSILKLGTEVVGPYALEIARDWAAFVVTAGLSNYFFGGAETAKQAMLSVFRSPPPGLAQLAVQSERAALLARGEGVAASFMKEYLKNFGKELLINSGFTAVQMSAEGGIHAAIGEQNVKAMGEWGQFGLSFGLSTVLALGQGALHGMRRPPLLESAQMSGSTLKFKLSPRVSEAEFVNHMKTQGFDVQQVSPGRWEVRPVNAGPGFKPISMENVGARGEGKPPVEIAPPNGKVEFRPAEPPPNEIKVGEQTWTQTPEGKKASAELQKFNELFAQGKYAEAFKLVSNETTLPKQPEGTNRNITTRDVSFDLAAYQKALATSPEAAHQFLQNFMSQMGRTAKVETLGSAKTTEVSLPKPVVEINGVKVDLITGEAIVPQGTKKGKAHLDAEAAVKTFKDSPATKAVYERILAEQAIIHMEERLHLHQNANGDKPFSHTYAEFVRDMYPDSGEHANALKGEKRSAASREQELILALHESGWSLQMLEHHFGTQHVEARAKAFEYLRAKEAIKSIPEGLQHEMKVALEKASPDMRRNLIEKMPELVKAIEAKVAKEPNAEARSKAREDAWFDHLDLLQKMAEHPRINEVIGSKLVEFFKGDPAQFRATVENVHQVCQASESGFRNMGEAIKSMDAAALKNPLVQEAILKSIEQNNSNIVKKSNEKRYSDERGELLETIRSKCPERVADALAAFTKNRAETLKHPEISEKILSDPRAGEKIAEFIKKSDRYPELSNPESNFKHELTTENGNHLFSYKDADGNICYLVLQKPNPGQRVSLESAFKIIDLDHKGADLGRSRSEFLSRLADQEFGLMVKAAQGDALNIGTFQTRPDMKETIPAQTSSDPVVAGKAPGKEGVPFIGASMRGGPHNGARTLVAVGGNPPMMVVLSRYNDKGNENAGYAAAAKRFEQLQGLKNLKIKIIFD